MRVLVIGGTLFIGRALVRELLERGHEVTILHRKPKHDFGRKVENLVADRNDPQAVVEALGSRRFEAVFDNVYDWERGTTMQQVEGTVRACLNDRLARYVFLSSVAAYGDGLNHKESDPLAPDYHADLYARHKATTERMLFRMHATTGLPVTTFRPPFVYGPGNPFYREQFFWDRIRANRPIVIPGDGYRLMQFVYVGDLVAAMAASIDEPRAIGEAFNIGDAKPLTQVEVIERMARAAGATPVLARTPREVIAQAGGNAMNEPFYFGEYFDVPPITEFMGKAQRLLKIQLTPFDEGLKETYRWYSRNHKPRPAAFDLDDRLFPPASVSTPVNA
jgi:2'-hydroxyisoflavone reductase